jgi:4a-hydroxytetrahydrobiopterin dehydratase
MDKLTSKKCEPCEGGVAPLTRAQFSPYLGQVKDWSVVEDKTLEREFKLKDFKKALAFINAVGEVAEGEGHHPDILLHGWNKVRISLWTHAIGGLSLNDFILAAKTDEVWDRLKI